MNGPTHPDTIESRAAALINPAEPLRSLAALHRDCAVDATAELFEKFDEFTGGYDDSPRPLSPPATDSPNPTLTNDGANKAGVSYGITDAYRDLRAAMAGPFTKCSVDLDTHLDRKGTITFEWSVSVNDDRCDRHEFEEGPNLRACVAALVSTMRKELAAPDTLADVERGVGL